ncbi:MAG: YbaK/prolyl-tRNA synthetase associated domain-containing protein [Enterobacterales bacterium endosymbiont of Blomia tropicalis]|uniref:YbaK/prolyl-tRNA synthetase associated domain-containing protein n=1 Tax=Mixta mediterraneensis TaxID=2758443 RepID=UPI001874B6BE|nr:YbaK/prolyl-tRNA synthetase associated domain-containing protein [Mixta mediterraneensis]MBE5252436.1 YbaK/prolyl-tRNA synthetase associated domain-containing protein [Mixta mediterraneensis]MDL4914803.1 YbaK/prolyl-tRNA synthetase associated domain-containing protein [Mixta mediterraneensis]
MTTHEKLIVLLDQHQARYRLMAHEATGKCEAVAAIRGTHIGQGAKALVCHVKGNGVKQYVLAVLPADQQADLSKVAEAVGGRRASLASPAEVDTLTGCVFGAIPPFSFHPDLKLVVDPLLFERFSEIAFNAGVLERSVILNTEDYRALCRGEWCNANIVKLIR